MSKELALWLSLFITYGNPMVETSFLVHVAKPDQSKVSRWEQTHMSSTELVTSIHGGPSRHDCHIKGSWFSRMHIVGFGTKSRERFHVVPSFWRILNMYFDRRWNT